ncbi:amino acid transporter, partial [Francisella tularensis subsp. holarctica]|nr:amino acid transporter [Francisella tularensis subsp. holarctica]
MNIHSNQDQVLGFNDVTIMAVTANFVIRWITVADCLGASAIFFWIVGEVRVFLTV